MRTFKDKSFGTSRFCNPGRSCDAQLVQIQLKKLHIAPEVTAVITTGLTHHSFQISSHLHHHVSVMDNDPLWAFFLFQSTRDQ
jgi:hypothetical protein